MEKKSMNVRNHVWLLLLVLFANVNLFAKSTIGREPAVLPVQQEEPKISEKSSTVVGDKLVITYNISLVNDDVLKALEGIKNVSKPGYAVAYVFLVFEVNKQAGTLKVELGKESVDKKQVLNYLQRSLDNSLKQ